MKAKGPLVTKEPKTFIEATQSQVTLEIEVQTKRCLVNRINGRYEPCAIRRNLEFDLLESENKVNLESGFVEKINMVDAKCINVISTT